MIDDTTGSLLDECDSMLKYALGSGLEVSARYAQQLQAIKHKIEVDDACVDGIEKLVTIHNHLARIIAPASPKSVVLIESESGLFGIFGPVRMIRHIMVVIVLFLVLFISLSLSDQINTQSIEKGVFEDSGVPLLLNILFLLCTAGLGACFAALFKANRYVVLGTYDPKFESTYWARIILGLVAGLFLATLIPLEAEAGTTLNIFGKPLLALLGGFSAEFVYLVLNRFVSTLGSFLQGDISDRSDALERSLRSELTERLQHEQNQIATELMTLQSRLEHATEEEQKQEFSQLIERLLGKDRTG